MEDKDAAGYLYNDLYPLVEENRLLFFPTGYKRSIQYGQEDASGLVQRTKALSALQQHEGSGTLALCTYPEALVEKVVGQKTLTESILKLHVGERLATSFVEEVLTSNRFERVEFVYEPGQYSIRGGIIDIFSYSSNVPYRIDFFGDEIDSIRPFDISTQLSTGYTYIYCPQSERFGAGTTGLFCGICRSGDLLDGRWGLHVETLR